MKTYLKQVKVVSIAPPATREQEQMAHDVDAEIVDYPTATPVHACLRSQADQFPQRVAAATLTP